MIEIVYLRPLHIRLNPEESPEIYENLCKMGLFLTQVVNELVVNFVAEPAFECKCCYSTKNHEYSSIHIEEVFALEVIVYQIVVFCAWLS